jgi:2-dehydro-3-deoxyphosphogalactonate aldolase
VSPHCAPGVISYAANNGMIALPGVVTPTEAFQALDAGAAGLKLFPAEMISPETVKSIRSVIPDEVPLLPVGGIRPDNMAAYVATGASGFGIGGQLFKPGMDAAAVRKSADAFMSARAALLQGK